MSEFDDPIIIVHVLIIVLRVSDVVGKFDDLNVFELVSAIDIEHVKTKNGQASDHGTVGGREDDVRRHKGCCATSNRDEELIVIKSRGRDTKKICLSDTIYTLYSHMVLYIRW